jgi:RNA polymerase sigma-70 factor (ECF subfamily)
VDSSAGTGIDPPIDAGIEVRALVARSRKGDANAFGQLYDRYLPEIVRYLTYRVGNPDTAEDLAQQVFLKAWQAIPRYEERGVPFKAWLYRMAHNLMVDHHRTRRPTASLEGIDLPEDPDAADPEAERQILAREAHAHLRAALDRLSEDHRQVLVLRFLLEKSAREVGEIMDRKEVTIRGLQMRALQALRREIDRDGLELSGGLS